METNSHTSDAQNNTPVTEHETATRKKSKKRDRSPPLSDALLSIGATSAESNEANTPSANTANTPTTSNTVIGQKKEKQRPETWNKVEQQIFFNALRQNGKNFESITQYFNARQKRFKIDEGVSGVQRSREQIRHFYYRTLHKITKYVTIPATKDNNSNTSAATTLTTSSGSNNISSNNNLRDTQVRCLIAYNTLMNKSLRWNKKTAIKLGELIEQGWTTVRDKGKITRLRMPICKLSSKTITKDEAETAESLPLTINIYLEPKTESAYCRVHRLAQNPFLNIEIQTLQSVKFLIEFLENKWKNRRNQFIEKFQLEANYQTNKSQNKLTNINYSKTDPSSVNSNEQEAPQQSTKLNEPTTIPNILEKLILYPSESHQISSLDLYEPNNSNFNEDVQHNLDLKNNLKDGKNTRTIFTNDQTKTIEVYLNNNNTVNNNVEKQVTNFSTFPTAHSKELTVESSENPNKFSFSNEENSEKTVEKKQVNYDENLMMIDDDCAILPDDFTSNNKKLPQTEISTSSIQLIGLAKNPPKASLTSSLKSCFKINVEQLKAGLTTNTSKVTSSVSSRETKDLTLIQLYLALNKPNVIRLKYDWILTHSNPCTSFAKISSAANLGNDAESQTSLLTLHSSQNQQQRFYIETLANVGASFLNDLQTKNNNSNSNTNVFVVPTVLPQNNGPNIPSNGIPKGVNISTSNSPKSASNSKNNSQSLSTITNSKNINKSPPNKAVNSPLVNTNEASQKKKEPNLQKQKFPNLATSSTASATANSSIVVTSALNDVDVALALKQFNEEQNNKTKKLLSDLNTKRRSRQRKSIIVVNTGNPPRNIVPKLNFNNELIMSSITNNIENNNMHIGSVANLNSSASGHILSTGIIPNMSNESLNNNQQLQQQNIVYSKPVAAVVRQIVSNFSTSESLNSSPKSSSSSNISAMSKTVVPNFHQIFNKIIENNSKSNNEEIVNDENNDLNTEKCIDSPPQTLNDMSLLDLSLNNNDSFLANLNGLVNNDVRNENNNQIDNNTAQTNAILNSNGNGINNNSNGSNQNNNNGNSNSNDFILMANKNENSNSIMTNLINANNNNGAFSSVSVDSSSSSSSFPNIKLDISGKICQNFNQILNENSNSTLTNIINSLNANTLDSNGTAHQNTVQEVSTNANSIINTNMISSGYSLTHKRSDICVEWTDSMNDISLTGCFLNDMQSPEKASKNGNMSQILNENSRDALFFNVDTIMEILPSNVIRYEDKSVIE